MNKLHVLLAVIIIMQSPPSLTTEAHQKGICKWPVKKNLKFHIGGFSVSCICLTVSEWLLLFLSPEQQKETVDLQHNSNDGPANQHHKHASKEETGGLHFVLLEEEAEGPFQPDDEGKSSNKQDLQQKNLKYIKQRQQYWTFGSTGTHTFYNILSVYSFTLSYTSNQKVG